MNYLAFLLQWYNWPYLAALLVGAASLAKPGVLGRVGAELGRRLGAGRASGHLLIRSFAVAIAVIGLTVNGGLHDYWPEAQEVGFLPGLVFTLALAAWLTRAFGRFLDRNFPEIKAVGWGSPALSGRRGRVVSRVVSPDYRAGRAQVIGDDETLHMVLCKTVAGEIPFGSAVELGEFDRQDGRYFVEPVDASERD